MVQLTAIDPCDVTGLKERRFAVYVRSRYAVLATQWRNTEDGSKGRGALSQAPRDFALGCQYFIELWSQHQMTAKVPPPLPIAPLLIYRTFLDR